MWGADPDRIYKARFGGLLFCSLFISPDAPERILRAEPCILGKVMEEGGVMKRILKILLLLAVIAAVAVAWLLNHRPDLTPYASLWLPPAKEAPGKLRITNLGVSTLLIDDGESAIMTDGFFSRPGLLKALASRIDPDQELITAGLQRAGVEDLMAVLVVHSHYDHAMDAPVVARQANALLVGSESTANVGRGLDLPEHQIMVVEGGETMQFGRFRISILNSRHFPHGQAMGDIEAPLVPPARVTDYQEGASYSILVEHDAGTVLIQGSAGFVEGALDGRQADVVLLGVGLLGTRDEDYMNAYWHEMVATTGARRVIPIHWDDFFQPFGDQPPAFPYLLDDFEASMTFLQGKSAQTGVDLRLAPAWVAVDPFEGLGD